MRTLREAGLAGRAPALAGLIVLAAAAGCTASPSAEPLAPAASTSSSTTPATPPSPSSAAPLTVAVTIAGGQVSPNGRKIDVRRGQTVKLIVTSDQDDEIHVHTAAEGYELEVKAGQRTEGSFVASDLGSFEIESHELGKIIAVLNVR